MFGFGKTRRPAQPKELLRCSFCGKNEKDVRKLVAGPAVFICDECVQICVDVMKDDTRGSAGQDDTPQAQEARARAAAERLNRDDVAAPSVEVPAWHVRCPLCEIIVPTEGAIPITGRGVLCRPCVLVIQATALHTTES
jgi:ClpX C4-type zinc finger